MVGINPMILPTGRYQLDFIGNNPMKFLDYGVIDPTVVFLLEKFQPHSNRKEFKQLSLEIIQRARVRWSVRSFFSFPMLGLIKI
ncbi:hypothetical protein J42TS3_05050 [Paenibacillus vini]|uniref:Uncharacterized protein n=1 Tax=Paenibacillus vini TaxID=1476024 RepID=A0ABQ4M664_9BACL|nr:hypothetical protein J42TS3_05050 [Paenibacillus vini]